MKKKIVLEVSERELFNIRSAVFQLMEKIRTQGYTKEGITLYTREYHEEIISLYDEIVERG
jgi:hypothetical protein